MSYRNYCWKSTDIVGYSFEGDIYCTNCADKEIKKKGDPIFANEEWDYVPACNNCSEELECYDLIDYDNKGLL